MRSDCTSSQCRVRAPSRISSSLQEETASSRELADVYKDLRRRQSHVERSQQALAAGDRHGLAAAGFENAIGMRKRTRLYVAEIPGLHVIATRPASISHMPI